MLTFLSGVALSLALSCSNPPPAQSNAFTPAATNLKPFAEGIITGRTMYFSRGWGGAFTIEMKELDLTAR